MGNSCCITSEILINLLNAVGDATCRYISQPALAARSDVAELSSVAAAGGGVTAGPSPKKHVARIEYHKMCNT